MTEWPARCTRVVFLAPRLPEMSGGATYVENMSRGLAALGVRVEHVSLRPGDAPANFPTYVVDPHDFARSGSALRGRRGVRAGLTAVPLIARKRLDRWWRRRKLRAKLRGCGSETLLVFTHVLAKQVVDESGWRPAGNNRPLMVGQHHSQFEAIDIEEWLRPAMLQHYRDLDALTALTEQDAEQFSHLLPAPCVGIGNPLNPVTSTRSAEQKEPLAVALARYSGEKQLDLMIRSFAAATSRSGLGHWRLEIYGEGALGEALQREIDLLGVGDRIRLAGRTDDVPSVLGRASVNLLTSSYEGFGMSILEAAAQEVPSIAFDVSPGVRDLIGEEGGYLVPAGDEQAFTQTLGSALADPEALATRGRAARLGTQRFSVDAVLERWAELLSECYRRRR